MTVVLQLLRIRQWAKNGFVLAPLFFGSELVRSSAAFLAASAFVIFCLASSAIYIFNDWCDLEADRAHARKKHRPLPSGAISIPTAFAIMIFLLLGALLISLITGLPSSFFFVLSAYAAANVGYSLGLKQVSLLELFLVASGFLLRLIAGGFAIGLKLSPWILVATAMIALLLVTGKRRGDVVRASDVSGKRRSLLHYNVAYLDAMMTCLTGCTLVTYLLFCVSDYGEKRFGPYVLLTAIPVALGLFRYLQLVLVEGKGDSPTDLVLGDGPLIATLVVFMAIFTLLIYF